MKLLFIGYELPRDLYLKYDKVLPSLNTHYQQVELEGDLMHLIPEYSENEVIQYIESINQQYNANLTLELIPYEQGE